MDESVRKQTSSLFTFRARVSGLYPKYDIMDLKTDGYQKGKQEELTM